MIFKYHLWLHVLFFLSYKFVILCRKWQKSAPVYSSRDIILNERFKKQLRDWLVTYHFDSFRYTRQETALIRQSFGTFSHDFMPSLNDCRNLHTSRSNSPYTIVLQGTLYTNQLQKSMINIINEKKALGFKSFEACSSCVRRSAVSANYITVTDYSLIVSGSNSGLNAFFIKQLL